MSVRLHNRLVDLNIDVKTEDQFDKMDMSAEKTKALSELFTDIGEEEEITRISELPGITERISEILRQHGIELIESLVALDNEELTNLEGLTEQDIETIRAVLDENVEIIEEEEEAVPIEEENAEEEGGAEEEESYECPECGAPITVDMSACPNCGVGLSFEIEESVSEEKE